MPLGAVKERDSTLHLPFLQSLFSRSRLYYQFNLTMSSMIAPPRAAPPPPQEEEEEAGASASTSRPILSGPPLMAVLDERLLAAAKTDNEHLFDSAMEELQDINCADG